MKIKFVTTTKKVVFNPSAKVKLNINQKGYSIRWLSSIKWYNNIRWWNDLTFYLKGQKVVKNG